MRKTITRLYLNTLSAVFHPLIYPTLAAILLFTTDSYFVLFEAKAKFFVIGLIFALTYLLPILIMPVLYMFNIVSSLTLMDKRERTFPLLFTGLLYYTAYFVLKKYQAILFLNIFLLASAITILLAIFVSFRWKISLHMIGIGGFLALIVQQSRIYNIDNFVMFTTVLLIAGLLGTARLALQAHKPNQIFTGFFTGFLLVFSVLSIVF